MPHPCLSSEQIHRRGQTIYDERLRAIVETPEHIGKEIVIDVETGDYAIDANGLTTSRRLLEKHPDAALFGIRIGYNAVYSLGGALRRTDPA